MTSFELSTRLEDVSFAVAVTIATYLAYRGVKPPNPTPEKRQSTSNDTIGSKWIISLLPLVHLQIISTGLLTALLSVLRSPQPPPRYLCQYPTGPDLSLLSWNAFTAASILATATGGYLRVLAYRQLGSNFTYELARPSGLVTGGLYKYMQHPSYTAGIILACGMLPLLSRFDGAAACWTPEAWRRLLTIAYQGGASFLSAVLIPVRVVQEERMMREAFGKEWEEYNKKTKRFIPGVF